MNDALDKPPRERWEAALDIAEQALRRIGRAQGSGGFARMKAEANEAAAKIIALLPERNKGTYR